MRNRKQGQLAIDMITIIIILFVVAVSFILGNKLLTEVNTDIQADADFNALAQGNLNTFASSYPIYMDNAFLIMLILFWVILIISSLFIDANPIFFIISVLLLFFVFIVGVILSNAYDDIVMDGEFITFGTAFPKTDFIMSNMLLVLIVIGFSSVLALYAKNQSGGMV